MRTVLRGVLLREHDEAFYGQALPLDLIHGDCVEVMRGMDAESVDAIVTDPPYELGFMGKSWDARGIANDPKMWALALRVLRPGGYLLAFGGTRTYHRMTCAIEDAGFEIRDCLAWLYGSGFPKSLDVSKAMDRVNGDTARALKFTAWMRTTGLKSSDIDRITGTNMGGHYLTAASQPAVPTRVLFEMLRPHLPPVPDWVETFIARVEAEREVMGQQTKARSEVGNSALPTMGAEVKYATWNITAPSTDLAKQWQGWGTALKPAHEPIVVARKPLIGTVASNVERYGTGALNIDGTRIGTGSEVLAHRFSDPANRAGTVGMNLGFTRNDRDKFQDAQRASIERTNTLGRWPANVVLSHTPDCVEDGTRKVRGHKGYPNGPGGSSSQLSQKGTPTNRTEAWTGHADPDGTETVASWHCTPDCAVRLLDEQSGQSASPAVARPTVRDGGRATNFAMTIGGTTAYGDKGGASRFFYTAKASRSERNGSTHPTVKPIALMRWLVRLVTPPGGLVLDPFAGSGTTGRAALAEGMSCILIEREAEYVEGIKTCWPNTHAAPVLVEHAPA